jgi:hypothetical protein
LTWTSAEVSTNIGQVDRLKKGFSLGIGGWIGIGGIRNHSQRINFIHYIGGGSLKRDESQERDEDGKD